MGFKIFLKKNQLLKISIDLTVLRQEPKNQLIWAAFCRFLAFFPRPLFTPAICRFSAESQVGLLPHVRNHQAVQFKSLERMLEVFFMVKKLRSLLA